MTKKIKIFENVYDLGVIAFVDYKMADDDCVNPTSNSLKQKLIKLGAKVEKTFNRKVNIMVIY